MNATSSESSKAIGVGIVGFGFIGKVHAYGYQNQSLFHDPPPARPRLVGVCTSREETAETAREVGGFEFGTTRFEDLLERDDIDIIDVATPNDLHRDQVVAALEAGKHVYCDKPLSVTIDEAREMMAAADAHPDLQTGMAFQMRFSPATMRARCSRANWSLARTWSVILSSPRACVPSLSTRTAIRPGPMRTPGTCRRRCSRASSPSHGRPILSPTCPDGQGHDGARAVWRIRTDSG